MGILTDAGCESDCEIDCESESDCESNYESESDCVSDERDCESELFSSKSFVQKESLHLLAIEKKKYHLQEHL